MATEFGPLWPLFWFRSSKLNDFFLSLSCKQSDKGTAKLPVVNKVSETHLCLDELSAQCFGVFYLLDYVFRVCVCTRAVRGWSHRRRCHQQRDVFCIAVYCTGALWLWVTAVLFCNPPHSHSTALVQMFYFCTLTQIFSFMVGVWCLTRLRITSGFIADGHE